MKIRYLYLATPQLWLGMFLCLLPSLLWGQDLEVVKKGEVRLSSTRTGASGSGYEGEILCINPDSSETVEIKIVEEVNNPIESVYLEVVLMDDNGQIIWSQSPSLMTREVVQNAKDTLKQSLAIDLSQFNGSIANGTGRLEIRVLGDFPTQIPDIINVIPPTYLFAVYEVCFSKGCNCGLVRPWDIRTGLNASQQLTYYSGGSQTPDNDILRLGNQELALVVQAKAPGKKWAYQGELGLNGLHFQQSQLDSAGGSSTDVEYQLIMLKAMPLQIRFPLSEQVDLGVGVGVARLLQLEADDTKLPLDDIAFSNWQAYGMLELRVVLGQHLYLATRYEPFSARMQGVETKGFGQLRANLYYLF
ncbi:MAG: hypothetical protein AB8H47_14030 [Bacteroidia bacterium]